jgi:hypothetical protein
VHLIHEDETQLMTSSTPPSRELWTRHWLPIALSSVGNRPHLSNIFEQYEHHWTLITTLWQFRRSNWVWMFQDRDFRSRVEGVFNDTSNDVAKAIPIDFDNLQLKLGKLDAERRVQSSEVNWQQRGRRKLAWRHLLGVLGGEIEYWLSAQDANPHAPIFRGLHCPRLESLDWLKFGGTMATEIRVMIFG